MYQQIRSVVDADFEAVDKFIVAQLYSNVPLVESIGHYIVEAGGKRLRPLLVLLAAKTCKIDNQQHISLASVIELSIRRPFFMMMSSTCLPCAAGGQQ